MNAKILIAGVAIAALAAGGASAKTHHKKMHRGHKTEATSSSKYAAPDQPIPYAQLDSYLASHGMAGGDNGAMANMGRHGKRHGRMNHAATGANDMSSGAAPSGSMPNDTTTPPAMPSSPPSGDMSASPNANPPTTPPSDTSMPPKPNDTSTPPK